MIFHSLDYLVFILVVLTAYWLLPFRGQNLLLLAASYIFYGYVHQWYLGLIFMTSTLEFFAAQGMEKYPQRKRQLLTITLTINFGLLAAFKYLDFFTGGNALKVVHALGFTWVTAEQVKHLLPVGISFYTFQSAAYLIDVYRGKLAPRKHWLNYLAFTSFFPQLVAGPIERAGHLITQLEKPRRFDFTLARSAIVLILWGYLKKLAIADNAAVVCNKVFALQDPPWPVLWAGVFAFAIQIYADFSAYTDIARGSARLLGIDLIQNFNHPYIATSPVDFWRRWHMSLSTWFRDYVYIPLGGSRHGTVRTCCNIMATFLLSGLWHGASWNFILWGGFHGLLLVIWRFWENAPPALRPERLGRIPQMILTFALINLGWLFFRETDLNMLLHYLTMSPFAASAGEWRAGLYLFSLTALFASPLVIHLALDLWDQKQLAAGREPPLTQWRWVGLQCAAAIILLVAILLLRSPSSSDFIYFQF